MQYLIWYLFIGFCVMLFYAINGWPIELSFGNVLMLLAIWLFWPVWVFVAIAFLPWR